MGSEGEAAKLLYPQVKIKLRLKVESAGKPANFLYLYVILKLKQNGNVRGKL